MKTENQWSVRSKLFVSGALLLAVFVLNGCLWRKKKVAETAPPVFIIRSGNTNPSPVATNLVIMPATAPVGRVARVNPQAKFVVVTFPIGQLPANEARFSVFHAGVKAGEIKITIPPPPVGDGVSADIIAGSAEVGDEVRAE